MRSRMRVGGASIIVDIALTKNDRNTSSDTQLQRDSFAHFKHFDGLYSPTIYSYGVHFVRLFPVGTMRDESQQVY